MALSVEELQVLYAHGHNHPALKQWIIDENWEAIASWYNSIPVPDGPVLGTWLGFDEREKFLMLPSFNKWYGEFCGKVFRDENIAPIRSFTRENIEDMATLIWTQVNEHKLADKEMLHIVPNLLNRAKGASITGSAIQNLFICLASDGVFNVYTIFIYSIEFSPYLRWQSLGLSETPTSSNCETLA